jgi:uncharacterized membrane protein
MSVRSGTLGPLDLRRALTRTSISLVFGALVAALLFCFHTPILLLVLGGGDAAGLLLVALAWSNIAFTNAAGTRARAAVEDPGRTAVYVLVLVVSTASILAATVLVRGAKTAPPLESRALVTLCLLTVALAWTLTHTTFTLRYAHLYYREPQDPDAHALKIAGRDEHSGFGGIEFPGKAHADYFDFAYFAFTIGMCFQVSDATITGREIRRAALLQAVMAFVYNTVILAFVLNLAFGLA